jgi:hypothetical protein
VKREAEEVPQRALGHPWEHQPVVSYSAGCDIEGDETRKSVRDGTSNPSPMGFLQMPPVILCRQPTSL